MRVYGWLSVWCALNSRRLGTALACGCDITSLERAIICTVSDMFRQRGPKSRHLKGACFCGDVTVVHLRHVQAERPKEQTLKGSGVLLR
jgi:hypothetical protein